MDYLAGWPIASCLARLDGVNLEGGASPQIGNIRWGFCYYDSEQLGKKHFLVAKFRLVFLLPPSIERVEYLAIGRRREFQFPLFDPLDRLNGQAGVAREFNFAEP